MQAFGQRYFAGSGPSLQGCVWVIVPGFMGQGDVSNMGLSMNFGVGGKVSMKGGGVFCLGDLQNETAAG